MSPMLKLVSGALACLLSVCAVHAQNDSSVSSELDFSKDPCGNPAIESQFWYGITGKVSKVLDGHTILLGLPDARQTYESSLPALPQNDVGRFQKEQKNT